MGAYTAWLAGTVLSETLPPQPRCARIDPARTLLVADFEPTPVSLLHHLGAIPSLHVLPAPPQQHLLGVAYHTFRTATNPIQWDAAVDAAIRAGVDTVAFFLPPCEVRGQTLLRLRRLGVRRILLLDRGRVRTVSPLLLALWRKMTFLGGKALRKLGVTRDGSITEERCRAILKHVPPRTAVVETGKYRIAHFVGSLNSGGADRQVCNAAVEQQRRGHDVRVLVRRALVGVDGHYRFLLEPHGVPARCIGERWNAAFPDVWRHRGLRPELFRLLPPELASVVTDLVGELLTDPVDVLHCYVDDCNVAGVIAAALAGTPAVILSFRNGNPSRFPGLFRPWMEPWYRAILNRNGVRLSANSEAGARDYERWLGLSAGAIPVVRNAFEPPPLPSRAEALCWRKQLGIAAEVPVVAGVFRLQTEKRPLYFLECIARLRHMVPDLRVVLAGVGYLEAQVRRQITAMKLDEVVILLGQQRDIPTLLAGSDVLLLVSTWEGTPNVLLESQHCGCIPVATDAGGSREALLAGVTGMLVGLDDLESTVRTVAELLADPDRRRRLAEAGKTFVAERFAPDCLYEHNLRLYRAAMVDGEVRLVTFSGEL